MQRLKTHQRAFIAAAVGGAEIYRVATWRLRSDFSAVVAHLIATLTNLGVPEETIVQIGGALTPLRGEIVTTPAEELAS